MVLGTHGEEVVVVGVREGVLVDTDSGGGCMEDGSLGADVDVSCSIEVTEDKEDINRY